MKRSEQEFPLSNLEVYAYLRKMWREGWLDEYSDKHFLIRLINGDDSLLRNLFNNIKYTYEGQYCYDVSTYLMNFNFRIQQMSYYFGEKQIENFVKNQLSAGKKNYNKNKFAQAMAEIEIIRYFLAFGNTCKKVCRYEPHVKESRCNPEASIEYKDGTIINIEVKTPEFTNKLTKNDRYMPLILLNDTGRKLFQDYCKNIGAVSAMPRILKLKEFLNSAAKKFEVIQDDSGMCNILFINWTYTEILVNGYYEACSLLYNDINGILKYPEIGEKIGVTRDVYSKISAIFVYQCPDEMMVFGDFRYLFASRSAAFLINPFVINTEEKKKNIYKLMRFRKNDFLWDMDLKLNFDVNPESVNENILKDLAEIIEDNYLK